MKTTLNLPDDIVRDAKFRALQEGSTLTDWKFKSCRFPWQQEVFARERTGTALPGTGQMFERYGIYRVNLDPVEGIAQ